MSRYTCNIDFHLEPWIDEDELSGKFPGYRLRYNCQEDNNIEVTDGDSDVTIDFTMGNSQDQGPDGTGFGNLTIVGFAFRKIKTNGFGDWKVASADAPNNSAEFSIQSTSPFVIKDKNNNQKNYQFVLAVDYDTSGGSQNGHMTIDPKIHNSGGMR